MRPAVLLAALALCAARDARAQESTAPTAEPGYSLAGWADRAWNRIADRAGGIFGRLAAEGILQRYHPREDEEYRADELTGAHPLRDAGHAATRGNVVHGWGASISNRDLVNALEIDVRAALAARWHARVRFWQDESLEAQRQRLWLAVEVDSVAARWNLWFGTSVETVKPDADLELGVARAWTPHLRVRVALAALDAFNDFNFVTLGVDSTESEFFRDYRTHPYAVRTAWEWRGPRIRVEWHAALTNRARMSANLFTDTLPAFEQREQAGYAGALVEWRASPSAVAGTFVRTEAADVHRKYDAPASARAPDFALRERTTAAGAYTLVRLGVRTLGEAALRVTDRRESRSGAGAAEIRDREWTAWASVWRRLAGPLGLRAGYAFTDRHIRGTPELARRLAGRQNRLWTDLELRFRNGAVLAGGVNWDLDLPRDRNLFDGAHGRLLWPL